MKSLPLAVVALVLVLLLSGVVLLAQLPQRVPRGTFVARPNPTTRTLEADEKIDPNEWQGLQADGKVLKFELLEDVLAVKTEFGLIRIPKGDIKRIEFGVRLSTQDQKTLDEALAMLNGPDARNREKGRDALLELGSKAYPAVVKAMATASKDASPRLLQLQERLKPDLPTDELELRYADRVLTVEGSVFTGWLQHDTLKMKKGEAKLDLKRSDALFVVRGESANPDDKAVLVASVSNLWQTHLNKVVALEVVGQTVGNIWGSNPYTGDSYVGMAAVHAGVLKPGEQGIVKLKILEDAGGYTGSTNNGVTSSNYPAWHGCYQIIGKVRKKK